MPALLKYRQSLKSLGIDTWTINRNHVFLGEVSITLENNIKLVILAEEYIDKDLPIMNDILNSLTLNHTNLSIFPLSKISHIVTSIENSLQKRIILLFKNLNTQNENADTEEIDNINHLHKNIEKLKKINHCHVIELSSIEMLYESTSQKRMLWREFCRYATD